MQSMVRWILLSVVVSAPAWAYPWMIKHSYASCAACHVDPSGSGQLTAYGRAQADVLVRWRIEPRKEDEEVPPSANFLWFLELPEFLNLSGNLRGGTLIRPAGTPPVIPLIMATDLYASINVGPVVAHVTTGFGYRAQQPATILPQCTGSCGASWTAREFWAGVKLADDSVMIRAGRTNVPFGLRNNEHTSWVRAMTRTDTNISQQVGVTASYNSESLRGEVMGIVGNFQVGPDAYRERGYSAFGEYALTHNAVLGVSSLITHANYDFTTALETTRHAHGLFARLAPTESIAVLMEADFLAWQTPQALDRIGFAALAQGDWEVMHGLHVMATLEGMHNGNQQGPSVGGWLSAAWYFLPHCELRLDNILRRLAGSTGTGTIDYNLLLQVHVFL